MGLLNDKRDVFTTIGAYNSLKENLDLPDPTNLYPSINNKDEPVPFLLDIMTVTAGNDGVKQLTGEMLTNMSDELEPQLKDSLGKQMTDSNSGNDLPSEFRDGISVPVKDIDVYGKLKENPNSEAGSLLYNNDVTTFDGQAYNAFQAEGSEVPYGNLLMSYDSANDDFIFKPAPDAANGTVGGFFNGFITGTIILDKQEFIPKVLNGFYGTLSTKQFKTQNQLINELTINKLIEDINIDDSFELSEAEISEINERARQMAEGIMLYDLGCGLMEVSLPYSAFTETVENILDSSSPHYIANQLENTINTSAGSNEETQERISNNKETISGNFFERIINIIVSQIIQALILTPQVRTLFALRSAFLNGGVPQIGNPIDDMGEFKTMIKCLNSDVKKMINEFIFVLILTFLIALLQPIILKIIKEKINQYIETIKSLISSKL